MDTDPLKGTTTDSDGYFSVENVPVGRYNIRVSYIGYEPKIIPEVMVGSAKEVFLQKSVALSMPNYSRSDGG